MRFYGICCQRVRGQDLSTDVQYTLAQCARHGGRGRRVRGTDLRIGSRETSRHVLVEGLGRRKAELLGKLLDTLERRLKVLRQLHLLFQVRLVHGLGRPERAQASDNMVGTARRLSAELPRAQGFGSPLPYAHRGKAKDICGDDVRHLTFFASFSRP